jgi:hypothetical protein
VKLEELTNFLFFATCRFLNQCEIEIKAKIG